MFHVLAYKKTGAAGDVNADMVGITDGWASLTNNHYTIPQQMLLHSAYGQGLNLSRLRLNTPSLRTISLPSITPINNTAVMVTTPPICVWGRHGPTIPAIDEIAVEESNSDAGAQPYNALLFLHDGNMQIRSDNIITVRGTTAITGVTNVWTTGAITLDQTLPGGTYDVVGMDVTGAGLIAARLQFPMQVPQPGVLARTSVGLRPDPMFRNGGMGTFGTFVSTSPPALTILQISASTTQEVFLDLVKVR